MNLQIQDMWSPDLHPPSTGNPTDPLDFEVFVQVVLHVASEAGREVFSFRVCSPSALARAESGTFITDTLVLERFDWLAIKRRLAKLLAQQRTEFAANLKDAERLTPPLVPVQANIQEFAAWTAVARVLLNLDEMLTKG